MAPVVVQALTRIHGLRYGDVATLELTPQVEALIENQKLAVVKDAAEEPPAEEPPAKPARQRAAKPVAAPEPEAAEEPEATDDEPKPARRARKLKETPAPEEE